MPKDHRRFPLFHLSIAEAYSNTPRLLPEHPPSTIDRHIFRRLSATIMDSPNKKNDASTAKKTEEEEKQARRRTSMEAAKLIEDEYEKIMNGG